MSINIEDIFQEAISISGLIGFQSTAAFRMRLWSEVQKKLRHRKDQKLSEEATLLELIGSGAFGRVYKATDNESGREIAVKIIDFHHNERKLATLKEAKIHVQLKHEHIIELFMYYVNGTSLLLHMEYFCGQTTREYIRLLDEVRTEYAQNIIRKVKSALAYMHEMNITHGDLHASNVLVNSHGNVKLIDFGLASKPIIGRKERMARDIKRACNLFTPLILTADD